MKKRIKNIEIIDSLSKGGMGEIYKGYHEDLEKYVVLKKILIKSKEANTRFKNEAKILIDLHHENIVSVFDYFKEENDYYILMDFIDGLTLRDIIDSKKTLPEYIILLIIYQILKGFEYFHKKNVIHRDIKPENIILSKDGIIKIVDFGIAVDEQIDTNVTKKGFIIGTPKYIAPELLKGEKATIFSDIYSLGIVLYELITNNSPFNDENIDNLFHAKMYKKIKKPILIRKDISSFLNKIVLKMLNKNPKKRGSSEILLQKIEKHIKTEYLKNKEEILRNYFFNKNNSNQNSTLKIIQKEMESFKKTIENNKSIKFIEKGYRNYVKLKIYFSKYFMYFIITLAIFFFISGFVIFNNSNFGKAILYPSKYSYLIVNINRNKDDNDFDKVASIYVDNKKIENNKKLLLEKGRKKLEIYYRGIYIYKELNLLSINDLRKIRKIMIPPEGISKLFDKIFFKKNKINESKYRIVGEEYLKANMVDKNFKYNIFFIKDIKKFIGKNIVFSIIPYDSSNMKRLDNYKIFLNYGKGWKFITSKIIKDFNFKIDELKIVSLDYYPLIMKNLYLSSFNYFYPLLNLKAGIVVINSRIDGVKIILNGEKRGPVGDEYKKNMEFGEVVDHKKILKINPGIYYLTLVYNNKEYTFKPFILKPDRVIEIEVIWNNNEIKNIEIKQ